MLLKAVTILCLAYGVSATPIKDSSLSRKSRSASLDRIQDYIETRLTQEVRRMESRFDDKFQAMKDYLEDEGECPGFIDEGKCFWVVVVGIGGMNYYDAERMCTYDGLSKLGNIYSRTQYDQINNLILSKRSHTSLTFINYWTAMKRDIPTGTVRLSDGSAASFTGNVRSSTEWRTDEARRTNIYVSVWTDGASHYDNPGGYGNVWPTFGWNAALCEYTIRK